MAESKPIEAAPGSDKKKRSKKAEPVSSPDEYIAGPGITTIAPEVIITIARLTAMETPGVCRMHPVPGAVNRFRRGSTDGIVLAVEEDIVSADLYIVVANNVNLREVSRNVQKNVGRAISEMVGINVGNINVHIEDIEFPLY
jgi:uncharacterized alkaline shock family protein YloU